MKVFVAENLSATSYLIVDIDMSVARNVRHSRCNHLPYDTHDCIPPRHRQLIFITEWIDTTGQVAQLNYSYSYSHDKRMTDSRPTINSSRYDLHSPRAF